MSRYKKYDRPLTFNWLFFDPANKWSQVHSTTIKNNPRDICVGGLEWVANLKRRCGFRADTFDIWLPKGVLVGHDIKHDWLKTVGGIGNVAEFCRPETIIYSILGDHWNSERVHFLVTADKFEGDEAVARKPPLQIMNRRFKKTKEEGSLTYRSTEYYAMQANPGTAIYNGSFSCGWHGTPDVVTVAPPIQIFHPVFQEFLDGIVDPEFTPEKDVVDRVLRLMPYFSWVPTGENAIVRQVYGLIPELLEGCSSLAEPDGVIVREKPFSKIPLILWEYDRVVIEDDHDPSVRTAYSLRDLLYVHQLSRLLDVSCCPTFFLCITGTQMDVYGAVHTDKLVVQHLIGVRLGEITTHGEARAYHIAKVFASLRRGLGTLDKYYGAIPTSVTVPPTPTTPAECFLFPRPCFFPYPTKFKEPQAGAAQDAETEFTEFEYVDVASGDPTNVTFFAKAKSGGSSSDRQLVVKFVERYGVDAHDLLAKEGMAPRLLYCGSLDGRDDTRNCGSRAVGRLECGLYVGPLRMVVMDRVEDVQERDAWPENARDQVKQAIDKLHEGGFVFGDLQAQNILFSGEGKAFFIDFDWAGKKGEARYPRGISSQVDWPKRAEELERELIEPGHDLYMLDKLFSSE